MSQRHCKYCGSADLQTTPRKITCNRCHISYEWSADDANTGGDAPINENPPKLPKKSDDSNEKKKRSSLPKKHPDDLPRYERVHEAIPIYVDGKLHHYDTVTDFDFRVFAKNAVPDLTIDAAKAEFFQWLFKDQVKKDRRYGRDWLKRHGYVNIGTTETDDGHAVKVWVHHEKLDAIAPESDTA